MAINQSFNQDSLGDIGIAASVSTSSPSYTTGTFNALSLTLAGALRTDGSAVTQPISAASLPLPSGAATSALQTTGNTTLSSILANTPPLGQAVMASSSPVVIASNQSAIPVTGTVTPSNAYAQGSTTSGQLGDLLLGAATAGSPTYTTATSNALSLTLAGALRVDGSAVTQPISATALPLPTGAATSALQTTGNTTLSTISGQLPAALGPQSAATSLSIVPATGSTFTVTSASSATANLTSVALATSSTTILAANAARKSFIVYNDSLNFLYLAFAATASTTAFSVKLQAGAAYNSDTTLYTGIITGISSVATGSARVTEFV